MIGHETVLCLIVVITLLTRFCFCFSIDMCCLRYRYNKPLSPFFASCNRGIRKSYHVENLSLPDHGKEILTRALSSRTIIPKGRLTGRKLSPSTSRRMSCSLIVCSQHSHLSLTMSSTKYGTYVALHSLTHSLTRQNWQNVLQCQNWIDKRQH